MSGSYCMYRGWMDDPLFAGEPFTRAQAFEWLIAEAAWKERKHFVNGNFVIVPRGSLIATERQLAEEWKWGRQKVRTFLVHLEKDEKLTRTLTHGLSQINICNYSKYQDPEPKEQPEEKPSDNPGATQEQPTIEEGKERKEIDTPPTPSPGAFDGFWKAYPRKIGKGQALKAWKAATRKTDPETITAALAKQKSIWADERTDPKFIPHPATWLNGERWADEVGGEDEPEVAAAKARGLSEVYWTWPQNREWLKRIFQLSQGRGKWMNHWSAPPGEPDCTCPKAILEAFPEAVERVKEAA